MKNINPFQLVVMILFALFGVVGVIVFATIRSQSTSENEIVNTVQIWGIEETDIIEPLILDLSKTVYKNISFEVVYRKKNARTFHQEFVEALAKGQGPDAVILPHERIIEERAHILPIPYTTYPVRTFRDTFIDAGDVFLTPEGVLALPFTVDPMIMMYNRQHFASAGVAEVPKHWDEFLTLATTMTIKDSRDNILRSTIALGEYSNILHAKHLLTTLMMQAGNPIVVNGENGYDAVVSEPFGFPELPASATLRFFLEFSNPVKPVYSWNQSLPLDQNAFLAGDVSTYFGFVSEIPELQARNPNLGFDIAMLPQARGLNTSATHGRLQGIAVVRNSPLAETDALRAAIALTNEEALSRLEKITGLPPTRRSLLAQKPVDAFGPVFYNAALFARAWYDPNANATDLIFRRLVETTKSQQRLLDTALKRVDGELQALLQ